MTLITSSAPISVNQPVKQKVPAAKNMLKMMMNLFQVDHKSGRHETKTIFFGGRKSTLFNVELRSSM
ncbi:MAG: hypothetical protein AAF773_29470 [Cyanobacteria bacterium P01_D01_bin.115]